MPRSWQRSVTAGIAAKLYRLVRCRLAAKGTPHAEAASQICKGPHWQSLGSEHFLGSSPQCRCSPWVGNHKLSRERQDAMHCCSKSWKPQEMGQQHALQSILACPTEWSASTWARLAVVSCISRQLALQLASAPSGLDPVTVCFHRPQTPTLGTKYILDLLKRALCSLGAALRARIGGDNMGTAVGQLVGQTMRRDAVTPPEPSRRAQQRTTQPKRPGQSTQAVRPRLMGGRMAPFHSL